MLSFWYQQLSTSEDCLTMKTRLCTIVETGSRLQPWQGGSDNITLRLFTQCTYKWHYMHSILLGNSHAHLNSYTIAYR